MNVMKSGIYYRTGPITSIVLSEKDIQYILTHDYRYYSGAHSDSCKDWYVRSAFDTMSIDCPDVIPIGTKFPISFTDTQPVTEKVKYGLEQFDPTNTNEYFNFAESYFMAFCISPNNTNKYYYETEVEAYQYCLIRSLILLVDPTMDYIKYIRLSNLNGSFKINSKLNVTINNVNEIPSTITSNFNISVEDIFPKNTAVTIGVVRQWHTASSLEFSFTDFTIKNVVTES